MTNVLLLEHFDQLLSTPDDVELLDRAILYLALQGKLVLQDPTDEPASELIKRIHESNHKQKISGKDLVNEKPYDLPVSWLWTTLPEIGEVNPRNHEVDDIKESSFIPMTYIPEEYAGELKFDVRPWGEIRKGFTHLKENDVAVAKITPCFENGKAAVMKGLVNGFGAGTTELHVFRGNPEFILPEYVLMFFKNYKFREDGKRKMTGSAGQQRVPKEHITLTPFPLPPYAEQQRIVARVEELFVQTRALAKELAHSQMELDGLNQSALSHLLASETPEEFNQHWDFIAEHFDLLFQSPEHIAPLCQSILELAVRGKLTRREVGDESAGELLQRIEAAKEKLRSEGKISNGEDLEPIKESEIPFQLPNGWEWGRLEELCSLIVDIAHQMPKSVDVGVKFISAKDLLDDGTINFERNIKLISEEDFGNLSKRVLPQRGDIIYSRIGARLGKARIVNTDERFMVSYSCCVVRPLLFDVEYLNFYLDSGIVLDQAQGHTKSIGVPDLGMKKIKSFLIAVPPLQEQQRIVARANELKRLCDALEARLQSAEDERGRLVAAVMSTVGG